ncbi:MAG TPA: Gfo/Idh/MocA family oxidoreductase [Propionibacteriaceae bacterium]
MAESGPVGVGFIGTGMISDTYLENLTSFPDVRVVILGDLDQDRARAQAEKYDIPQWGSSDDVLTHPDVEIIVNLTIPPPTRRSPAKRSRRASTCGRRSRSVSTERADVPSSNKPNQRDYW